MSYAGIYEDQAGERSALGQITKSPKLTTAQINFLLAPADSQQSDLIPLLEELIKEAGTWGAKQATAEMLPEAEYFSAFRQAGFSVFAKQRVYEFDSPKAVQGSLTPRWRIWTSDDIPAMRGLYQTLVPPLIQPVEPITRLEMLGLVHYDAAGTLQAFADLVYGPVGIWVNPFVHPQTSVDITALLLQLVADLPDLAGRPVYLISRSYQPWIESALETSLAGRGPEQALLVRHIAIRQRVFAGRSFKAMESGNPEPTFPVTPITERKQSG